MNEKSISTQFEKENNSYKNCIKDNISFKRNDIDYSFNKNVNNIDDLISQFKNSK